jgi:Flp pilus assembly protein TadD
VLRAAHEKHPGDIEILIALATISNERGAREEAIGYARKLVALAPDDLQAKMLLHQLEQPSGEQ